jgi:hypothetical protein
VGHVRTGTGEAEVTVSLVFTTKQVCPCPVPKTSRESDRAEHGVGQVARWVGNSEVPQVALVAEKLRKVRVDNLQQGVVEDAHMKRKTAHPKVCAWS